MMIDKISGINQVFDMGNTKRSNNLSSQDYNDVISVSDEARSMADAMLLDKIASETPDIRTDLVEQIKLEMQDPNFFSEENIAATADRVLSAYGL